MKYKFKDKWLEDICFKFIDRKDFEKILAERIGESLLKDLSSRDDPLSIVKVHFIKEEIKCKTFELVLRYFVKPHMVLRGSFDNYVEPAMFVPFIATSDGIPIKRIYPDGMVFGRLDFPSNPPYCPLPELKKIEKEEEV